MLLLILNVIFVLIAIAMIALILMQRGAGAQAGSGFGGGASATVFGSRGSSNFLSKATKWLAIAFFAITLYMAWSATHNARPVAPGQQDLGVMGQVVPPAPDAAPKIPSAPAQNAPSQIPVQQSAPVPQAPAQPQSQQPASSQPAPQDKK